MKHAVYVCTSFYLTTVASHFPSAHLSHRSLRCNEQHVCQMWRVSVSWRKTFPSPCLNMASKIKILTAKCWTNQVGWFRANWNTGRCCMACGHLKWSEWCVMVTSLSDKIVSQCPHTQKHVRGRTRSFLTHWGRGHLNCLNAHSRGVNNLNQLLYCISLNIYNKFAC